MQETKSCGPVVILQNLLKLKQCKYPSINGSSGNNMSMYNLELIWLSGNHLQAHQEDWAGKGELFVLVEV